MAKTTTNQPPPKSKSTRCCCLLIATLICLFTTTIGHTTVGVHPIQINTAVSVHALHIDFFFDTGAIPDKQVTGYRLYMDGDLVCETEEVEPQIQSIACTIVSEDGTYAFTLSALYDDNSESPQSGPFLFTLLLNNGINEPPTAVLSSSTAAGNAPLSVTFDGSSSTTPNPPMVKYHWKFGDGSEATGRTASHAYSTAGTYHAELTVTDNLGLTDNVDTPIVVLATVPADKKPTTIIMTTSQTEGDVSPRTSFDGPQSSDSDGSIDLYDCNYGETATVSKQNICSASPPKGIPNFEAGELDIDSDDGWVAVDLVNSFIDPVVIAGPPTANDSDPVLVRIRNITAESFEIRLQEWEYLDGVHASETVSYVVMEKGIYELDDGIKIEAGSFTGSSRFRKVRLQQSYDNVPVILTQVTTDNDTSAVTGRTRNSYRNSFRYKLQAQQKTKRNTHDEETIGYIAWEPGAGEVQGVLFEAGLTFKRVTERWFDLNFQTATFMSAPLFIADMQTYKDRDPAALRSQDTSIWSTQIMAEEEKSKNNNIKHRKEIAGYLVIGSATE